jgi:hypothetical protein
VPRTITCPDLCINKHTEAPGDAIHHYWPAVSIPTMDGGKPLVVYVGFFEHDRVLRVEVGGASLDLSAARMLFAELGVKVSFAERQQAALDADAYLDELLNRRQVA